METKANILVVGHACLDNVAVLSRVPGADEKIEADLTWIGGGGPGANAAVALRRLGHDVRLWCGIGNDPAGEIVVSSLRGEGVRLVSDQLEGTTSFAQIRAVDEERSIAWLRGKLAPLSYEASRESELLDGIDLLYLDGHEVEAATPLLLAARQRGIACIADLGSLRPGAERWCEHLEWLAATPRYLHALGSWKTGAEAIARLHEVAGEARPAAVTLGARGGIAWDAAGHFVWTPRKVGVVDTTGAGDAFHAGLADAYLQGMDFRDALDWAATLGAAICRGAGGRQTLPKDRTQLTKWHGRWGFRAGMNADSWHEQIA